MLSALQDLLADEFLNSLLLQSKVEPGKHQEVEVSGLEVIVAVQVQKWRVTCTLLAEVDRHLKVDVVADFIKVQLADVGVLQDFAVALGQRRMDLDLHGVCVGS